MSEEGAATGPGATPAKLRMVLRAQSWSVRARVNRSGREEGEVIVLTGNLYAPTIDPSTPLSKARAEIKVKGAQDRMAVRISKDGTIISLPLEEFAMERISAKIKELSGGYGLDLGVEFEAGETTDQQPIEFAEFTFSSRKQPAAQPGPAAAVTVATPAPMPASS